MSAQPPQRGSGRRGSPYSPLARAASRGSPPLESFSEGLLGGFGAADTHRHASHRTRFLFPSPISTSAPEPSRFATCSSPASTRETAQSFFRFRCCVRGRPHACPQALSEPAWRPACAGPRPATACPAPARSLPPRAAWQRAHIGRHGAGGLEPAVYRLAPACLQASRGGHPHAIATQKQESHSTQLQPPKTGRRPPFPIPDRSPGLRANCPPSRGGPANKAVVQSHCKTTADDLQRLQR